MGNSVAVGVAVDVGVRLTVGEAVLVGVQGTAVVGGITGVLVDSKSGGCGVEFTGRLAGKPAWQAPAARLIKSMRAHQMWLDLFIPVRAGLASTTCILPAPERLYS